jgi:hypothetical protein
VRSKYKLGLFSILGIRWCGLRCKDLPNRKLLKIPTSLLTDYKRATNTYTQTYRNTLSLVLMLRKGSIRRLFPPRKQEKSRGIRKRCVKVPLRYQSSTNMEGITVLKADLQHLKALLPPKVHVQIQKLVELNDSISLNQRALDHSFSKLLEPFHAQWETKQQQECSSKKELAHRRPILLFLNKYLHKEQLMKLRREFADIPEENIEMYLIQEQYIPTCERMLRMRRHHRAQ